ncbi:chloramphenicol acetyltransferase [Flavobacterium sp. MAH-1]|uniref:Chloramphenicol acetyltransferase n=1 Tax=Flavobacterium agri TaxID=2743471 RepID=A0A7Y8Y0C9_9FLAO|nr:chloramphenicol acetyltransferase [Flavobacterium agri]NUY80246.1 chloramphenicol acetyltransferase [Flavobacterium agri]NYA70271.1 chloramphenicol acetyltransferase [Flavobacterium agri]
MKTLLDLDSWPRKEHFDFFRKFSEPFFGSVVTIDCTNAYDRAKTEGVPFFVYYLHKTLIAANEVEPFRYRVDGGQVVIHDRIDASATIARENASFGFSLIKFYEDIERFSKEAKIEIHRVQNTPGLFTRDFPNDNLIHFSSIPWLDFTSLSHARNFDFPDSCPKISFGKMTINPDGKRTMPMSVHVHHALMDGYHMAVFVDRFRELMG